MNNNNYVPEVSSWLVVKKSERKLGGDGLTVEIDKSMFKHRQSNKGRMLPQPWIFGSVYREQRRLSL